MPSPWCNYFYCQPLFNLPQGGLQGAKCCSYGTLSIDICNGINSFEQMGRHFGAELYQREVEYLMDQAVPHQSHQHLHP